MKSRSRALGILLSSVAGWVTPTLVFAPSGAPAIRKALLLVAIAFAALLASLVHSRTVTVERRVPLERLPSPVATGLLHGWIYCASAAGGVFLFIATTYQGLEDNGNGWVLFFALGFFCALAAVVLAVAHALVQLFSRARAEHP